MALSLNKPKLDNLADQIWKSAQRLRGKFKAYEYQNVILPIIVIRRLECVLLKWRADKKTEIRVKKPKISDKELDALVKKLEQNRQLAPFSNKTDGRCAKFTRRITRYLLITFATTSTDGPTMSRRSSNSLTIGPQLDRW